MVGELFSLQESSILFHRVDCILLSWILYHMLQKVRMVGELQTTDCLHGCTYITHYHTLQMVAELFLQTWTAYTAGSAAYRWAGTRRRSKPLSSSRLALQMFWDTYTSSNTNTNTKQITINLQRSRLKASSPVTVVPIFTDVLRQNTSSPFAVQLMGEDGMCLWSYWLSTNLRFFGRAYIVELKLRVVE